MKARPLAGKAVVLQKLPHLVHRGRSEQRLLKARAGHSNLTDALLRYQHDNAKFIPPLRAHFLHAGKLIDLIPPISEFRSLSGN